jgi:ArsR family transcriptional regulator, arsenate/arsenite/antimonite-responsive transcriptional repressor
MFPKLYLFLFCVAYLKICITFVSFLDEILNMLVEEKNYYTDKQEKVARFAKALSHPVRVFILDYLGNNLDKCCYSGDMAEELPIARSTLSEHLKELKKAGLIQGEINPPYIKYCINRENWEEAKLLFSAFFKR